jgi:hypothetical protein
MTVVTIHKAKTELQLVSIDAAFRTFGIETLW